MLFPKLKIFNLHNFKYKLRPYEFNEHNLQYIFIITYVIICYDMLRYRAYQLMVDTVLRLQLGVMKTIQSFNNTKI